MKDQRLVHPLYSLDPSARALWFFGRAKTALRDRTFADADALVEPLTDLWDRVTSEALQSMFQNWIERSKWVIEHNGDCFIK
jgi:hypothetical protein